MVRSFERATLAGALSAPLTLGVLVALPFLSSLMLPGTESPSTTTELLGTIAACGVTGAMQAATLTAPG